MHDKAQLREDIRRRLKDVSPKEFAAESRSICRRMLEILPKGSAMVAAYYPMADEIHIISLLDDLLSLGHKLYLPRFEQGRLAFRTVVDLSTLRPGTFNIPEPLPSFPELDPTMLDIAIVPGRAFDRSGNRLGRGNGGYDHWISFLRKQNSRAKFYGVCYECQLVADVPVEAHDEKMDCVVTARGILRK